MTGTADLGVAAVQFAPGPDVAANLAEMRRLGELAASRGARLIAYPEYSMYFGGPFGPDWLAAAESLDGAFASGLAAIARDTGATVVAGMSERLEDDTRFANTLVARRPDGTLDAVYRKLHLYDAFGERESDWIRAGAVTEPVVLDVDGIAVGLQTCYDLRFPEVTRRLVDAGAELILVPSEWVRGPLKEHHWRTLVTARAIENTVYVAAPDHAPPVGAGRSTIVDPMGVELASVGDGVDVAVAWVSRDRIAAVRERNPSLRLRRFRVEPIDESAGRIAPS